VDVESLRTEPDEPEKTTEMMDVDEVEETVPKRALVIGGGIAGIQAALDLANARIQVTLVEKSPSLGGRMAQLDKTFPTMDCSI
jgi:heterodisulfide reductase subunit A